MTRPLSAEETSELLARKAEVEEFLLKTPSDNVLDLAAWRAEHLYLTKKLYGPTFVSLKALDNSLSQTHEQLLASIEHLRLAYAALTDEQASWNDERPTELRDAMRRGFELAIAHVVACGKVDGRQVYAIDLMAANAALIQALADLVVPDGLGAADATEENSNG